LALLSCDALVIACVPPEIVTFSTPEVSVGFSVGFSIGFSSDVCDSVSFITISCSVTLSLSAFISDPCLEYVSVSLSYITTLLSAELSYAAYPFVSFILTYSSSALSTSHK